ncbi:MAG: response regulator [Brevundimonas sp.]|uniref:response regulator n=1 Tax=Brevundimonas sp. TaxID=1871086 RepID=UPI004033B901
MPRIDAYTEATKPVGPETTAVELLSRFEAEADLHHLPVLDGERVLGLIERSALLMRLTVSPAAPMTAAQLMDPEPVVVDGAIEARPLCEILLKGGPAAVTRGFIVTSGGRYHSVGSAPDLLRAVSETPPAAMAAPLDVRGSAADASQLIGMVEAEMSAPIKGILAVVDLLRRHPLTSDILDHVQSIDEQARGLMAVVHDAAELVDSGPRSTVAATSLRTVMDDVEADWVLRAGQNGVTLLVSYEGDTELVADLDATRLRRVFDCLIGRSLKYASEGMVEARLKAIAVGGDIQISAQVRDDAPGVVASHSAASAADGAEDGGFALTVSRRLVAGLGGRLWVDTNAGRGSTVNLELNAPRSAPVVQASTNVQILSDLELQSTPHVLIVDDNATNRVVAQALCEMFGCSCETAEDGVEALEAVENRAFDLILMDIKMPRMDGVQATRAIRALDGPQRHVPIIALTANADPADAAAYVAAGMIAVVEKPIKPERLRMAMNAALVPPAWNADDETTSVNRSA